MDVVTITNEYRVKMDGIISPILLPERSTFMKVVNFQVMRFMRPLLTMEMASDLNIMYDDGTDNRAFLNDTRKDTDGDGVSDFWEKTFGSNPEDRNSVPIQDLSNPTVYNSIDFNISNAE